MEQLAPSCAVASGGAIRTRRHNPQIARTRRMSAAPARGARLDCARNGSDVLRVHSGGPQRCDSDRAHVSGSQVADTNLMRADGCAPEIELAGWSEWHVLRGGGPLRLRVAVSRRGVLLSNRKNEAAADIAK